MVMTGVSQLFVDTNILIYATDPVSPLNRTYNKCAGYRTSCVRCSAGSAGGPVFSATACASGTVTDWQ